MALHSLINSEIADLLRVSLTAVLAQLISRRLYILKRPDISGLRRYTFCSGVHLSRARLLPNNNSQPLFSPKSSSAGHSTTNKHRYRVSRLWKLRNVSTSTSPSIAAFWLLASFTRAATNVPRFSYTRRTVKSRAELLVASCVLSHAEHFLLQDR